MDVIKTTVILNVLAILGMFGSWKLELSSEAPVVIDAQAIPWPADLTLTLTPDLPAFVLMFILNPLAAILVLMR